jgi:hypothetical protein
MKYVLFDSMYRMTHLKQYVASKDSDRYESSTEGDKHILQVANGVLWSNCRNTTIIKVSQVFFNMNIYSALNFGVLAIFY